MQLVKGRKFRPLRLLVPLPLALPYFFGYVPVWKLSYLNIEAPASWGMQWLHGLLLCALVALTALALLVAYYLVYSIYDSLFEKKEEK